MKEYGIYVYYITTHRGAWVNIAGSYYETLENCKKVFEECFSEQENYIVNRQYIISKHKADCTKRGYGCCIPMKPASNEEIENLIKVLEL